ncbi:acyl carrier protein [Micromonospora sp. C31]|uniref:acyl carrier protein n=1 Tax=Micromonospora sp. C31 TaxID=2824876 RepID=UPI001B385871|nr:acyl carrier protein [Micromonospora sp. C31]MBQ1075636.1 acyl carrier protein [Micromonospora sp. C31]
MTTQSGELAAVLTDIWQEALGVNGIEPDENFADLGGDSMTATVVTALIRERLGVEAPLRLVFDHPTVAELTEALVPALAVSGLPA